MIPVTGCLPQMAAKHDRSGNFHITVLSVDLSPVIQQCIFQNHSFWQEEWESRTFFTHHKQSKLFAQFSVVTFLCFFHTVQIFFQICFLCERSTVNSGQHLVFLTASPVCTCKAGQFKCFYRFGAHQMRSCTEVYELTLLIEADFGIFRKIFDQFYFIWFFFFFEICDCFFSGLCETCDRQSFFYNLFHFCFDLHQIFCCQRCFTVHIIVESVCHGRSDCKLYTRVQSLDRLCHDVRSGVMECPCTAFAFKSQNV